MINSSFWYGKSKYKGFNIFEIDKQTPQPPITARLIPVLPNLRRRRTHFPTISDIAQRTKIHDTKYRRATNTAITHALGLYNMPHPFKRLKFLISFTKRPQNDQNVHIFMLRFLLQMRQKSIHLHSTIILPFKICIHPSLDTSSHERRTNDYSFQSYQNTTFNIFSSGTWSTGGVMAENVIGSVFFESTEQNRSIWTLQEIHEPCTAPKDAN